MVKHYFLKNTNTGKVLELFGHELVTLAVLMNNETKMDIKESMKYLSSNGYIIWE